MVADPRSLVEKTRGLLRFGFLPPPLDGMQTLERMGFLYESIGRFAVRSSGIALEIGCYKGCSAVFLARACLRKGIDRIYAIDLFTGTPSWRQTIDTFEEARARLARYGLLSHVTLVRSHSQRYDWTEPIDVLHLDADHEYPAVSADIRKYAPFLAPRGIVIFDDYDAEHPGVRRAVHEWLLERQDMEIVGLHHPGPAWGSVCLRRSS